MRGFAWLRQRQAGGVGVGLAVAVAVAAGGAGWAVSDRLEARNDFCNACHLPDGTPLHEEIREDFDRLIPVSLGGVHGRAFLDDRPDAPGFRCIDCHAGAGPLVRARVKVVSAFDAARYAVGAFEEPDSMPFPLPRALCLECHERLRHAAAPGWSDESFHAIPAHEREASLLCVDCHAVHERDGDAFAYFLDRRTVRAVCAECHEDFEAGAAGVSNGSEAAY